MRLRLISITKDWKRHRGGPMLAQTAAYHKVYTKKLDKAFIDCYLAWDTKGTN
jgi:hypothetical protein